MRSFTFVSPVHLCVCACICVRFIYYICTPISLCNSICAYKTNNRTNRTDNKSTSNTIQYSRWYKRQFKMVKSRSGFGRFFRQRMLCSLCCIGNNVECVFYSSVSVFRVYNACIYRVMTLNLKYIVEFEWNEKLSRSLAFNKLSTIHDDEYRSTMHMRLCVRCAGSLCISRWFFKYRFFNSISVFYYVDAVVTVFASAVVLCAFNLFVCLIYSTSYSFTVKNSISAVLITHTSTRIATEATLTSVIVCNALEIPIEIELWSAPKSSLDHLFPSICSLSVSSCYAKRCRLSAAFTLLFVYRCDLTGSIPFHFILFLELYFTLFSPTKSHWNRCAHARIDFILLSMHTIKSMPFALA